MDSKQLDIAEEILEIIKGTIEIDRLINEAIRYELGENFIIFNKGPHKVKIEVTISKFETLGKGEIVK